ncbi:MAG: hypothetical protein WDO73_33775 [Ignavibacteriota bacterium]
MDVVESRTNDLGPYPLLLRLGKEEHHARVAQHLTSALAETTPAGRNGAICVVVACPPAGQRALSPLYSGRWPK